MKRKILIIEDHTDSREVLADALEFADFEVLQAGDGIDGERKALETRPDLILLDISLPGKSGWEIASTLKGNEKTKEIPIIALTAHARPEDQNKSIEVGCSSYISKPVKPKEVLNVVTSILNESS